MYTHTKCKRTNGTADSKKTRAQLESDKNETSQKTGTLSGQKLDIPCVVMVRNRMIRMGTDLFLVIKRVNN